MTNSNQTIAETIVTLTRVAIAFLILIGMISATIVLTDVQHTTTYSEDHFTIAETADGETITVYYETTFTEDGLLKESEKHDAIDDMELVSVTVNDNLDSYISSHKSSEIDQDRIESIVDNQSTEQITVTITQQ